MRLPFCVLIKKAVPVLKCIARQFFFFFSVCNLTFLNVSCLTFCLFVLSIYMPNFILLLVICSRPIYCTRLISSQACSVHVYCMVNFKWQHELKCIGEGEKLPNYVPLVCTFMLKQLNWGKLHPFLPGSLGNLGC